MGLNQNHIAEALSSIGVRQGVPVLLHSSLSSFGHVEGGADTVLRGVINAVGPLGTVLVPTLTGAETDGPEHPPQFDRDRSPCWTGRIPETLRTWPGSVRSLHPTHSVAAIGRLAEWITRDHWLAKTPCGLGSPFARIAAEGGQVVLFGVDWNSCTMIHGIEETARVPYHMQSQLTQLILTDGARKIVIERCLHNWDGRLHKDFNRMEALVDNIEGVHRGRVGDSETIIIDAERLWSAGMAKLIEDPWFLVTQDDRS